MCVNQSGFIKCLVKLSAIAETHPNMLFIILGSHIELVQKENADARKSRNRCL